MARKQEILDLVDKYWETANQDNKDLMDEYLESNLTRLSKESLKQYSSSLKIWISYINMKLKNKHIKDVRPLEFQSYQNYLFSVGIFEANIKLKRSAISNLNEHCILYHGDKGDTFEGFRNFVTSSIKTPVTGKKFEKEPLTDEEFKKLCDYLEEKGEWQKLSWLYFVYISGCRKAESGQILKSIVDYPPIEKDVKIKDENGKETIVPMKKYKTNPVHCKGRVGTEKRKLSFDEQALCYFKKYLEVRGDDNCPYMFISGHGESAKKVSLTTFNDWMDNLEIITGRRLYPHLLRTSRATSLAETHSIESIQKLLHHANSSTTQIYIVRDEDEGEDEVFV